MGRRAGAKSVKRDPIPFSKIYKVLDRPRVFRLTQRLCAPGAQKNITGEIRALLETLPNGRRLLDLGCGPRSWLSNADLKPIGLDVSPAYMSDYVNAGGTGVVASAAVLPFATGSFDGVWSIGLFHHLPDEVARRVVGEALRVCNPGGYAVIIDAVLPETPWRRPVAYGLRRLDRGRFMRSQHQLEDLLAQREAWSTRRVTYALNGLELLICTRIKPQP